jgi:hypothetical protein
MSILRDCFRVRSQGDWLGLSHTMTSGSTYGIRVDNTVGYFALTSEPRRIRRGRRLPWLYADRKALSGIRE